MMQSQLRPGAPGEREEKGERREGKREEKGRGRRRGWTERLTALPVRL